MLKHSQSLWTVFPRGQTFDIKELTTLSPSLVAAADIHPELLFHYATLC